MMVAAQPLNNFEDRVQELSGYVNPVNLVGILAFLVISGLIARSRFSIGLILLYLCFCCVSGSDIAGVSAASTLGRWWLIGCFCLAAFKTARFPGTVCVMLACHWGFSLVSSFYWSPEANLGIQTSALAVVLFSIAASGISGILRSFKDIKMVFGFFSFCSIMFVIASLWQTGRISGARFGGLMGDAYQLFVITGGLMLPGLLWLYSEMSGRTRFFAGFLFAALFAVLLLSGQRAGFFAGVIACLPMLRLSLRKILWILSLFLITFFLGKTIINYFPDQREFVIERILASTDSTAQGRISSSGRSERWSDAIEIIKERPFIGYGASSHKQRVLGGFHNAYLQEWHNCGIVGLIFFAGASVVCLYKSGRLAFSPFLTAHERYFCRLLFSLMTALFLVGFYESKLASPSNLLAFILVLLSISIYRMEKMGFQRSSMTSLKKNSY